MWYTPIKPTYGRLSPPWCPPPSPPLWQRLGGRSPSTRGGRAKRDFATTSARDMELVSLIPRFPSSPNHKKIPIPKVPIPQFPIYDSHSCRCILPTVLSSLSLFCIFDRCQEQQLLVLQRHRRSAWVDRWAMMMITMIIIMIICTYYLYYYFIIIIILLLLLYTIIKNTIICTYYKSHANTLDYLQINSPFSNTYTKLPYYKYQHINTNTKLLYYLYY
jgi:hypothetical protein